jgi:hypothetical protein
MTTTHPHDFTWRSAARTIVALVLLSPVPLIIGFSSMALLEPSVDGLALLVAFAAPMAVAAVAARLTGYRAGGMAAFAALSAASVLGWGIWALSQMTFD